LELAKPFTKTGKGWKQLQYALEPSKFTKTVEKHMSKATKLNGALAVAAIRRNIKSGKFEPNQALTVAVKGSNKPLVDSGHHLYGAITWKSVAPDAVFVGVLMTNESYNIAKALHDGVRIKVTPAMRGLFFILWQVSIGKTPVTELKGRAKELWDRMPGGWLPLSDQTQFIVIPARPFIAGAFKDQQFRKHAIKNWNQALKAAMREMAAR
jgi:hypothetical protein